MWAEVKIGTPFNDFTKTHADDTTLWLYVNMLLSEASKHRAHIPVITRVVPSCHGYDDIDDDDIDDTFCNILSPASMYCI